MSVTRDKSVICLTVAEAVPSPVDSILDLVVFWTDFSFFLFKWYCQEYNKSCFLEKKKDVYG